MSNERFIKYIPSEKTFWLRQNYPNAYLLLSLIAERARRNSGHIDGLEIGDAYIGDYQSAGIETEKKYRIAKQILLELKIITIKETCRNHNKRATQKGEISENDKNRATSRATKGTLVTLLDSSIWDINSEQKDDLKGDLRATLGRPQGDEQERRNNEKKEKEKIKKEKFPKIEKIAFRDLVTLTQEEHDKLLKLHGDEKLKSMLDKLNSYKGRSGKKYKSDYYAMDVGSWVVKECDVTVLNGNSYSKPQVDRRTKNKDGIPVTSPADGRF